jgi:hypothetical protein
MCYANPGNNLTTSDTYNHSYSHKFVDKIEAMTSVVPNKKFNLTEPETIVEMASTSCLHQYQKIKLLFGTGTLLAANNIILTNRLINAF